MKEMLYGRDLAVGSPTFAKAIVRQSLKINERMNNGQHWTRFRENLRP